VPAGVKKIIFLQFSFFFADVELREQNNYLGPRETMTSTARVLGVNEHFPKQQRKTIAIVLSIV